MTELNRLFTTNNLLCYGFVSTADLLNYKHLFFLHCILYTYFHPDRPNHIEIIFGVGFNRWKLVSGPTPSTYTTIIQK